jgi:hypothetical protein
VSVKVIDDIATWITAQASQASQAR